MHAHRPNSLRRASLLRVAILFALILAPLKAIPYSVQTHEQLIDLTWKESIRPLLLKRFPKLTEAQLHEAHAYAYGGCAIQDLGYYPFGKPFFSDLTHYVRPGDFVLSLIRNAHTPDELAFAIGALSHYIGDTIGHSEAINQAVAIEFPKLEKKYGPSVTYEEGEHPHVRTEFAFDVNEISKRRFAPSAYLKHVGLDIPAPLLRRAFFQTYGLDLRTTIGKKRPVMRGYRFSIRRFLPRIAYAEVILHRHSFPADTPGTDFDRLTKDLAQSDFENGWDQYRKKAGIGTYMLAGIIYILPRIGPLSDAAIRVPNPHTQDLYVKSLNNSTASLRYALAHFNAISTLVPNRDLDTGAVVRPGTYRLTDETYAKLLAVITSHPNQPVPSGLKRNIDDYYADPAAPICTKKHPRQWAQLQAELKQLQTMPITQEPLPSPAPATVEAAALHPEN